MRCLAVWILLISTLTLAETRPGGDLAPLGNPDGVRNAGDLVVLTRLVQGSLVPTERQKRIGDVAPLGNPDGALNAADILILTRALMGQVTLPDVYVGPDAPTIGNLPGQSASNPVSVSGNALPGEEIRAYVNGVLQQSTQASAVDGGFSMNIRLDDGANSVYFTAWDGVLESQPSASSTVSYTNTINRNQADTYIATDTVWTAGSPVDPYIISGDLIVAAGATLIIQPGAVLQFAPGASIGISGGLELSGTATGPIQLTSTNSTPRTGDWQGILVNSGATNVTLRNAVIEWANIGIDVMDLQTLTLDDSTIRNSKTAGIWMRPGSGGSITNTQIEYSGVFTGSTYTSKAMGMRLTGSSPTITGCSFRFHRYGMYIEQGASPVINGTTFSDNDYGLGAWGDYRNVANNPSPTVKRNAFFNNSLYSYITQGYVDPASALGASIVAIEQDLSENWWGSTDPLVISAGIYDYVQAQGFNAPIARLVPFLDAENGSPVPGNYLNGLISQSTTIPAGTINTVLGALVVANNAVLTIEEGAQMLFATDSILSAQGGLWVNGTTANPARFDALSATPQAGEWRGITLYANGSRVAGADIRFATSSIQVLGDNTTVIDSMISDFSRDGVLVTNGVIQAEVVNNSLSNVVQGGTGISFDDSDGVARDNTVDNADTGIYARLTGASITSNRVTNNTSGIRISGDVPAGFTVAPTISGNLISNNNYGINITKYGNQEDVNPVIRDNQIYSNTTYNYFIKGFGPASILDAALNWWGSEDEAVIRAGLNSNQIQYSPYLNSLGDPVYSTRGDGVLSQDTIWSAANGPYTLTDSVLVPAGIQLTIEAGVQVKFPPGARLIVNGELDLQTTEAAPALFTSTIDNPASTDYWGGLLINNANQTVHHLQVENVQTGVEVKATNVSVKYNTFISCSSKCVYYLGNTDSFFTGNIENNRITVNNRGVGRGIWVAFYDTTIQGNYVEEAAYGISVIGRSDSTVLFNWLENNQTGMFASSGSENGYNWDPNVRVQGNNLLNNARYNYETGGFSNAGRILGADDNWWGTTVDSEVQAGIYDDVDGPSSLPTLSYTPFATNFIPLPPELTTASALTSLGDYPVAGVASPGAGIRLYVGGVQQAELLADAAGKFSGTVMLVEGLNRITARSFTASRESTDSNPVDITLDTIPPVITLMSPSDGALTNRIEQIFNGAVNETVVLTINGQPVSVASDNSFGPVSVLLSEGLNSIDLVATDVAGNIATLTTSITLDSTPPADPDMQLVTFAAPSAGNVPVSGAAGSVEANTTVSLVNTRTGEVVTVTANSDGSFSAAIGAGLGDSLSLVSADDLGNQAAWAGNVVAGMPPALAIGNILPADNSTVNDDAVNLTGTWAGPANTGIAVNGQVAAVYGDRFVVNNLPLQPGANSIVITATAPDGTTLTQTISLTGSVSLPFELSLSPDTGIAPLTIGLSVTNNSGASLQSLQIDFENNSIIDFTIFNVPPGTIQVPKTYFAAGFYTGNVRIVDNASNIYVLPFMVVVEDPFAADARRRSTYSSMLDRLRASDITGAVDLFESSMRAKYLEAFNVLSANIATLPDRLGTVRSNRFGGDYAELLVTRNEPRGARAYKIILVRGADGVWRIQSM